MELLFLDNEEYQKLCLSVVRLGDYCRNNECNLKCNFFTTSGCILLNRKPEKWFVPTTIIKGMNCVTFDKKEEQQVEPIKEGD